MQQSEASRWECEFKILQGENEKLHNKISTLESNLAFTVDNGPVNNDIDKVRRLNVELLEQNNELKNTLDDYLACNDCDKWKDKTEKLASKYF